MSLVDHCNRFSISELLPKLLDFENNLNKQDKLQIDLFDVIKEEIIIKLVKNLNSEDFEVSIYIDTINITILIYKFIL